MSNILQSGQGLVGPSMWLYIWTKNFKPDQGIVRPEVEQGI